MLEHRIAGYLGIRELPSSFTLGLRALGILGVWGLGDFRGLGFRDPSCKTAIPMAFGRHWCLGVENPLVEVRLSGSGAGSSKVAVVGKTKRTIDVMAPSHVHRTLKIRVPKTDGNERCADSHVSDPALG